MQKGRSPDQAKILQTAPSTHASLEPLLKSKLFRPQPRAGRVPRQQLVARIDEGTRGPLTLISAPAGFGKTALLAEWAAQARRPIAWLALDTDDNSPARFFSYLVAALRHVEREVGNESLALLRSPQTPPMPTLMTPLLAELGSLPSTMLVLDDYHVISTQSIHDGLIFLIEHLPPPLHLVIATRADPPVPLARLRARGDLRELRAADLRFTVEEAASLLNENMALGLTHKEIQALEARTEGWIAGLQLAALSLQGRTDHAALIRVFSGSNRHILDYLGEEVLSHQSEPIQQFLLKTSVLDRLCGSLCDALLNESSSQSVLEYLEQANLFVMPLDDERKWYRYHHLFADLLRARFQRTVSADEFSQLHHAAAQWYEENGFPIQAVNHALAAHDTETAARIVEQNTLTLLTQGELATLLNWIKMLPEALTRERPWLCVEQAWALGMAGQVERVEPLLQQAGQNPPSAGEPSEAGSVRQSRLNGHIAALRAFVTLAMGQSSRALALADQAAGILPREEAWVRTVVEWTRGYALREQGNLDEAARAFAEHVRAARSIDNPWAFLMGIHDLASVYRLQGRLKQAEDLLQKALDFVTEQGMSHLGYVGRVEAGLALLFYERNRLAEAERHLLSSIEKNRLWQNPNHIAYSHVLLARVLLAQGNAEGAQQAMDQAHAVLRGAPLVAVLKTLLETTQVRLWLATGNLIAAAQWAQALETNLSDTAENRDHQLLTRARVWIAQHQLDQAIRSLAALAVAAEQKGYLKALIEIKLLEALTWHKKGNRSQAFKALEEAMTRGEPEGYVRVYLDEGEPMRALVEEYLGATPGQSSRLGAYAGRLLEAFRATRGEAKAASQDAEATAHRAPALAEPLSERELQVLQYLGAGLSYPEIASRLVVARGTVKAHVHNIYGKLGAPNRTQALARARDLGLL